MSIKVGDKVYSAYFQGEYIIGEVVRAYKDINLAIVEYEVDNITHTVKARISDLRKYQEPKEVPKKKS